MISAVQLQKAAIRSFLTRFRRPCECPLELRAEGGAVVCVWCDRAFAPNSSPNDVREALTSASLAKDPRTRALYLAVARRLHVALVAEAQSLAAELLAAERALAGGREA